MKKRIIIILSLLVFVSTAIADLFLCPGCGWENEAAAAVCSHCSEKLSPSEGEKDDVDDMLDDSEELRRRALQEGKSIDPGIVKKDVVLGKRYLEAKKYAVAYLFFKNAMALELLTDISDGNDRALVIAKLKKQAHKHLETSKRKCRACKGTGTKVSRQKNKQYRNLTQIITKGSCKRCNGQKYLSEPSTATHRKFVMGQAQGAFLELQQRRKYVSLGNAWIPRDLERELTTRQVVVLKRAVASPCSYCLSVGFSDCRKCQGAKIVDCSGKGCKDGEIESKDDGRLVDKLGDAGNRALLCPECRGKGYETCSTCSGKGGALCKKCGGTGLRSICTKCSGRGLLPCSRCNGTAVAKDKPCMSCAKQGVVECRSCKGEGRKK